MTSYSVIPAETREQLPPHRGEIRTRLSAALDSLDRKIVVLDDDPTGVQTVNNVYVYTSWDRETLLNAFQAPEKMFFVLTNSRGLALVEAFLPEGKSVAVFTRRERLDLPTADKDRQLQISTQISDALTSVIGKLSVRPSFIVAKGGITSSDVGTKALQVRKALVKGQIRPGIPVWQTGEESRFPGLPYVIFPGNVGAKDDLKRIAETPICE